MKCPGCGGEMNEHARKVIAPRNDAELAFVDEELGGIVLERHACPSCSKSASRVQRPK
jgi:ribosomal protein S27AE